MAIPDSFLQKLARRLRVAPEAYDQFASFMQSWQPYEGGHTNNTARHNYLNTTRGMPGATNMNDVGVKAFRSEDDGVEATAKTLENGFYDNLLRGLRTGQIDPKAVAPEVAKWGTKQFAARLGGGTIPAARPTRSGKVDPSDPMYASLKKAHDAAAALAQEVMAKYRAGDPIVGLAEVQAATSALADAQKSLFAFRDRNDKLAQQDWENSVKLGDISRGDADTAFTRWVKKREDARAAASAEVNAASAHNQNDIAQNAAYAENKFLNRPGTGVYRQVPRFADALKKWEEHYGATGEEPPADWRGYDPGVGLPEFGGGGGDEDTGFQTRYPMGQGPGAALDLGRSGYEEGAQSPGAAFDLGRGGAPGAVRPRGASSTAMPSRLPSASASPTGTPTPGRARVPWWKQIQQQVQGVNRYAGGTMAARPGPAMMGEQGPEHMLDRNTGQLEPVGQFGPEVRNLQGGETIIPAGVPPDEALGFHQISSAAQQGGNPRAQSMAEAQARANDPQLAEKVMASLHKAIAGQYAAQPPRVPRLVGNWPNDPWAEWRPLTEPSAPAAPAPGG